MVVKKLLSKKKISTTLIVALLALSMIPMFTATVEAAPVVTDPVLVWLSGGDGVHDTLTWNPEWLKARVVHHVSHDTWIHVLGKDTYGQNVEAKAFIPACTGPEETFDLIDVHSGDPVTFAKITDVYQQGGEHCNVFEIHTKPCTELETWLGTYHPPVYTPQLDPVWPVEPCNPEPIKVVVNWVDKDGDGQPDLDADPTEFPTPPTVNSTIVIKGLDENGEELEVTIFVPAGARIVNVGPVPIHTWSVVCTLMEGEGGITYDIFTEPMDQRAMLKYMIRVHDIEIEADPINILADGNATSTITVYLVDIDGHEVHWTVDDPAWDIRAQPAEVNVAASGGEVDPSLDIKIIGCETHAHTTLTSDTNPRIVKVSVLVILPKVERDNKIVHRHRQISGYIEVCFDGINSVPYHKEWEIVELVVKTGRTCAKRDAVFRRLEGARGGKCNLISIPVVPDERLTWDMLPCASQCLMSVATYRADLGVWLYYDYTTGTGDIIPIVDGWAYWVKAEKDCTLVISGRHHGQYDPNTGFGTPPSYPMAMGWNFVGVTSSKWILTEDYLESLKDLGLGAPWLWGPVWVYRNGKWWRNPSELKPTEGVWVFTYDGILAP